MFIIVFYWAGSIEMFYIFVDLCFFTHFVILNHYCSNWWWLPGFSQTLPRRCPLDGNCSVIYYTKYPTLVHIGSFVWRVSRFLHVKDSFSIFRKRVDTLHHYKKSIPFVPIELNTFFLWQSIPFVPTQLNTFFLWQSNVNAMIGPFRLHFCILF